MCPLERNPNGRRGFVAGHNGGIDNFSSGHIQPPNALQYRVVTQSEIEQVIRDGLPINNVTDHAGFGSC